MSGLAAQRAFLRAQTADQEVTLAKSQVVLDIRNLQRSLAELDKALRRFIPAVTAAATNGAKPKKASRRRRLSAKIRAALVLQGRYMGFMRQLKPRQKIQVRKVKETRGVRPAIATARKLAQT
jgi:hypothetical protein